MLLLTLFAIIGLPLCLVLISRKFEQKKLIKKNNTAPNDQPPDLDYHQEAINLCRKGEDPFPMLIESHKQNLLYLKKQGTKRVKILTGKDECVCKYCSKLDGKTFDIDQALEEMPIPGKCRNNDVFETGQPFCRCVYVGKAV